MVALALGLLLAVADHPCLADADRLCRGVEPGGGRVVRCLKQHEADLSQACKDNRKTFRERVEQIRETCNADAEKFCSAVVANRGAVARCLRGRLTQLSDPCRKSLEQIQQAAAAARARFENIRVACSDDEQKLCPNENLGSGGNYRCLKQHEQQLALDCKRALAESPQR
jgi:hypothetical protein